MDRDNNKSSLFYGNAHSNKLLKLSFNATRHELSACWCMMILKYKKLPTRSWSENSWDTLKTRMRGTDRIFYAPAKKTFALASLHVWSFPVLVNYILLYTGYYEGYVCVHTIKLYYYYYYYYYHFVHIRTWAASKQ